MSAGLTQAERDFLAAIAAALDRIAALAMPARVAFADQWHKPRGPAAVALLRARHRYLRRPAGRASYRAGRAGRLSA